MKTETEISKNFEFFNSLSGLLRITTKGKTESKGTMMNFATSKTKIKKVSMDWEVYQEDEDDDGAFRPLTEEEWNLVAFIGSSITLNGAAEIPITITAPNKESFTIRELCQAVEEVERLTREKSVWCGGIDLHHVFFEGIHLDEDDNTWHIYWGS